MNQVLENSEVDRFSPTWKQILKEIGGEDLFGAALRQNIEEILAKNQLTPAVAVDELEQIRVRLEQFHTALTQVIAGFTIFRIADEKLEPGECEIGMLIPRAAVDNSLPAFADELNEFTFILNNCSEVSTGRPGDFSIRTISSSDLLIYLAAIPPLAACVATAVDRVISLYKGLLEIRKLQGEIQKQGIPEAADIMAEHANTHMERGIEKVAVEIVQEFYQGKDGDRKNELTNGVRISLTKIANRIDRGYNLEVRCAPLAAPDQADDETKKAIATVQAASENMQFLKLEGKPILTLPEKAGATPPTKKKKRGQKEESSKGEYADKER